MRTTTKRIDGIDVLKGIGIILVILGHMKIAPLPYALIYGFHMPLFIFASGLVFKPKSIAKMAGAILIPYVIFGVLSVIGMAVFNRTVSRIPYQLLCVLLGGAAPAYTVTASSALWFLPALFIVQLVYLPIEKCINSGLVKVVSSFAIAALGFASFKLKGALTVPYNIDVAFVLLPFFTLGRMIRLEKIAAKSRNTKLMIYGLTLVVSAFAYILTAKFNGSLNIYRGEYGNNIILYYAEGMTGTLMTAGMACFIGELAQWVKKPFIVLGRNTLVIMCVHVPLITIFYKLLQGIKSDSAVMLIVFFAVITISLCLSLLYNKLKTMKTE